MGIMAKQISSSLFLNKIYRALMWLSLTMLWSAPLGCNLLAGNTDQPANSSEPDTKTDTLDKSTKPTGTQGQISTQTVEGESESQAQVSGTVPEGAIAQVNGTPISQESFDQLFEERARVYRLQKRPIPPRLVKTYKTSALQKLIDQTLLQQYFEQNQITLDATEQDAAYQSYKSRFRGEQSYQRFLERSDKSEDSVKEQVYFDALVDKALTVFNPEELNVTEDEIKNYYEQFRERKYVEQEQVRVSHLLVPAPKNSDKNLIRKQKSVARKLYSTLRKVNPQEFAKAAQEQSADFSTKMRGGDLGYFERKGGPMINEEFEAALSKMEIGEISEPILTPVGYHLIRLVDRQPPQVRVSHILLKKGLSEKEIVEIKTRAQVEDFHELAKEISTDEMTRIRGGDLGFIHAKNPHRFGEDFKTACLKGETGELLGPINSAEGQHLVYISQKRAERYRASQIVLLLPKRASRAQKKEVFDRISKIHTELLQNKRTANSLFVRLAKKYSEDATRDRGGDLGAFYLGGEPKISLEFEEAAFKAPLGKVDKPIQTPFGWHLIFAHDRKPRRERGLEEVRSEIQDQLKDKRLRRAKSSLIKELRKKGEILRYLEL